MDTDKIQIVGQQINTPILITKENLRDATIEITKSAYPLDDHGLYILTKSTNEVKDWQKRMLQIGVGLALPIIFKYFSNQYHIAKAKSGLPTFTPIVIFDWEYLTMSSALGFGLVLYIIGRCTKSEREILIDKIKEKLK